MRSAKPAPTTPVRAAFQSIDRAIINPAFIDVLALALALTALLHSPAKTVAAAMDSGRACPLSRRLRGHHQVNVPRNNEIKPPVTSTA